jgi:hypothetical protein
VAQAPFPGLASTASAVLLTVKLAAYTAVGRPDQGVNKRKKPKTAIIFSKRVGNLGVSMEFLLNTDFISG